MTAVNISPLPHFLATIRRHEQPFVCIVSLVCLKDRGGGDFSIGSDVHLLPLARWTLSKVRAGSRGSAAWSSLEFKDDSRASPAPTPTIARARQDASDILADTSTAFRSLFARRSPAGPSIGRHGQRRFVSAPSAALVRRPRRAGRQDRR